MKVSLVQINSKDDIKENLLKFKDFLVKSCESNVDLVIFPENTLYIGDMKKIKQIAKDIKEKYLGLVSKIIKNYNVDVILGGVPYLENDNDDKPSNRLLYFDSNGEIKTFYDKIHLFKIDNSNSISNEPAFVKAGKNIVNFKKDDFNLGLSICYDIRFPELYRKLIDKGVNTILLPAAFTFKTGSLHWESLIRARAIENQSYLLAVNQVGKHGDFGHSYGNTSFIKPDGSIISLDDKTEDILIANLDIEEINSSRNFLPALKNRVL